MARLPTVRDMMRAYHVPREIAFRMLQGLDETRHSWERTGLMAYRRIYDLGPMRAHFAHAKGWVIDGEVMTLKEICDRFRWRNGGYSCKRKINQHLVNSGDSHERTHRN